jgi:hypothetical protein
MAVCVLYVFLFSMYGKNTCRDGVVSSRPGAKWS